MSDERYESFDLGRGESRSVLTYIDGNGDPQCVAGPGSIPVSAELHATLSKLLMDLELALGCIDIFGGIPVPVKQELQRSLAKGIDRLAAAHILHDMANARLAPMDERQRS